MQNAQKKAQEQVEQSNAQPEQEVSPIQTKLIEIVEIENQII